MRGLHTSGGALAVSGPSFGHVGGGIGALSIGARAGAIIYFERERDINTALPDTPKWKVNTYRPKLVCCHGKERLSSTTVCLCFF